MEISWRILTIEAQFHKFLLSEEQKLRYIFFLFLITVSITDFILTKKKKEKKPETFTFF